MSQSFEKFKKISNEAKTSETAGGLKSDSVSKILTEEDTLLDENEAFLNKSTLRVTSFQFEGVRFTPKVIEFADAFEGKQFTEKLTIQNVGQNPVFLKIGEPKSFVFQLKKPSRRTKLLAAGSSITKTITYSYHNDDLVQKSQIPIQINGQLFEYPIIVKRAMAIIDVQPPKLNFRVINLGATARTLSLTIFNNGGKRTKFEIDMGKNDLDLVVNPLRGTVSAKSQIKVWVEMMGLSEGEFYKELWIKTSEVPIRVPVLVEVVRPRLKILHPNGTLDFTLIDFKPTYNGSQKANSFVLKNYSAEATLFITLAEVNGELQFLKDARKFEPAFTMFMLTAEEGRLEPFEHRILTILFRPHRLAKDRGWRSDEKEKTQNLEHIVFFRMNRVHCIERKELAKVETKVNKHVIQDKNGSMLQASFSLSNVSDMNNKLRRSSEHSSEMFDENYIQKASNLTGEHSPLEEKVLRLCLHGKAIDPDVDILPTELCFDEFLLGQTQNRVLRLTNNAIISVRFVFLKLANLRVQPDDGWLEPNQAKEVLVSLTPFSGGIFKRKLKINILAKSEVVFDSDSLMENIATLSVPINFNVRLQRIEPSFNLGLGISQEYIFKGKEFTFKEIEKAPRAAKLLTQTFRPKWMDQEPDQVNKVDNAIIALPNDRPGLSNLWPKNKVCRTIFAGLLRYAPPKDLLYADSSQTLIKKTEHRAFWGNYIKLLRKERLRKYPQPDELEMMLKDYEVSCKHIFNLTNFKFTELQAALDAKEYKDVCSSMLKRDTQPRRALVPLSPLYLSNVTVEPKLINFSLVAAGTAVQEMLLIKNMNTFPIGIRFIPGKSAVMVLEGDTILISPRSTKSLQISFQTKDLGRHYGFLNYVINGSHEFKITISAFVTNKTLMVDAHHMFVEFGNYPESIAFQPRSQFMVLDNMFQSPVKYHWFFPVSSTFAPDMNEGEVPPRFKLCSEIVFDIHPNRSFYAEANLISESGNAELIRLIHATKKCRVNFIMNNIDMGDIPLNLPTKTDPIIQNESFHDISFQVCNYAPMPGVIVDPKQAVIRPRSFFPLDIKVQIPVIMKFSFEVDILVNATEKITVKVSGNVVMPVIRMTPTEIVMRKVCVQSFDTFIICVENVGTTRAEVTIDLKGWPEYSTADGRHTLQLLPNKSSKFILHFEPKDVARCLFYLPITINNILGPAMMQEPTTERVAYYISALERAYNNYGDIFNTESSRLKIPFVGINCTVSPCLLKISNLNIIFRLIPKSISQFQSQTLLISNEFADKVTFCLRTDNLGEANKSPFSLIPEVPNSFEHRFRALKADLNKGETLALKATFTPQKAGLYTAKVPVFIRDYNNGTVYNYINLKGEFKKPRLFADSTEIHFPPLPLEVGCDAVLTICAENYHTAETITCLIWDPREGAEPTSDQLTTTWLSDPTLSTTCFGPQMFQLQVNFRSAVPVALRSYLLFLDSRGEYCTVFVTATADNSAVTTHAFLMTMTSKYRLIRDTPDQKEQPDEVVAPKYHIDKSYLKEIKKSSVGKNTGEISEATSNEVLQTTNNACSLPIDKGPRLVIQVTKSMSRPTQLSYVNLTKNYNTCKSKGSSSTVLIFTRTKPANSFMSRSDSYSGNRTVLSDKQLRRNETSNGVTHPNFPVHDHSYAKHFHQTLIYVERWIYEVVMRCDQYFTIPCTFQKLKAAEKVPMGRTGSKFNHNKVEKDFLDFLEEVVGSKVIESLPQRLTVAQKACPPERAERMYSFFSEVLRFLENHGCLLPHVKPEFLFNYDNYVNFYEFHESWEIFKWRNVELEKINSLKILKEIPMLVKTKEESLGQASSLMSRESWKKSLYEFYSEDSDLDKEKAENGKAPEAEVPEAETPVLPATPHESKFVRHLVEESSFIHHKEVLDKTSFENRAKQAWLDVLIQIFRQFVLTRVYYSETIPKVQVVDVSDRLDVETADLNSLRGQNAENYNCAINMEANGSNLYCVQERILLTWLNHHFNLQKKVLWKLNKEETLFLNCRVINNFDKDLADSVALIALTASHCPYIVNYYFFDVFGKPDTPTKVYHNAAKLVMAWRFLNVGFTVESNDIVKPNPVFMIMLVTQLYNVLPTLYPRSLVCFTAPLTSEITRTIQLKNESPHRIFYNPKFIGDDAGVFRLSESSLIELKPSKTSEINIIFTARKIRKVSATLLLSGCIISPHFAKDLAFYLEGQPSGLMAIEKHTLSFPMHQVIDTEIVVQCPYPESSFGVQASNFELWYTTVEPKFIENVGISGSMSPWSKIWKRKVSRRLFLNQEEVSISSDGKATLSITVGCLSEEERFFWVLFRNPKIGDFIIMIDILMNGKIPITNLVGFYSEFWLPASECSCPRHLDKFKTPSVNSAHCPLLLELKIPTRNEDLWNTLTTMFFKTLHPDEKFFWADHFEENIGICLILWMLSPDEEEAVVDEFVHVLLTEVSYKLKVLPPNDKLVQMPEKIDIEDVRKKSFVSVPIHLSKKAPAQLKFYFTMTSENKKEVRKFQGLISHTDVSFSPEVCSHKVMSNQKSLHKNLKKKFGSLENKKK